MMSPVERGGEERRDPTSLATTRFDCVLVMTTSSRSSGKAGKGGKAAGGKGDKGKGARNWSSKRPVGGKGIFVTTLRGKESRCVGEFYDLLDEVRPEPRSLAPLTS